MINNFKSLYKILNHKEKKILIILFFMMILATFLETLSIAIIIPFIRFILQEESIEILSFLNNFSFNNKIYFFLFLILLIFSIKSIYLIYFKYWHTKQINLLRVRIAKTLFSKYLNREYNFFINKNSSELIRNNFYEVGLLSKTVGLSVTMMTEIMTTFGLFLLMIYVTPLGFLVAFFVFVPVAIFIYSFFKKTLVDTGEKRLQDSNLSIKKLLEGFNTIREIKNYAAEDHFLNKFNFHSLNLANVSTKIAFINILPAIILEYLGIITFIFVFILLFSFQNLPQNEIIAIFSLYILASLRILPSVSRLLVAFQSFKNFSPSLKIIYDEISFESKKNKNYFAFKNSFEMRNIDFSYNMDSNKILKSFNFKINQGEAIGIIGESGKGKTTLVNIILGLLEPNNGDLLLENNKLPNSFSWGKSIGVVPQNIYVTDETIKENIAFGVEKNNIDHNQLNKAIKLSRIDKYILNLDAGIDTIVGERGIKLSGGQLQRLGIARALYNDPELLIFDEATSNLDEENELKIMDLIYSFKNLKTSIIISHNKNNLNRCDRIINLN